MGGGRLRGGWAQGVGSHDDALAIGGDDQHVGGGALVVWAASGGVERLDVDRSAAGERLDLAFAHVLAGGSLDRSGGLVERSPRCFCGRQAAQPVAVALGGQVQCRVGGIEVRVATTAVGETPHVDLAEDGRQRPTAGAHLPNIGPVAQFGSLEQAEFPHGQRRTADSLVATLATKAGMLVMPEQEHEATLGRIRAFLASRPETARGEFTLPMLTGVLRVRRL